MDAIKAICEAEAHFCGAMPEWAPEIAKRWEGGPWEMDNEKGFHAEAWCGEIHFCPFCGTKLE
jgi:hypothetical protein